MRKTTIVLFLIGGLGFAQQATAQTGDAPRSTTEKLLTAHVEFLNQSYCREDDESFVASLNLKLQLINTSRHSVILSRNIEPPSIVRAARDLQSGEKGNLPFAPDAHSTVAELPDGPCLAACQT
jgi:hypothetical protein